MHSESTELVAPSGRWRRIRERAHRRWLRASKENRWTLVIGAIAGLHVAAAGGLLAAGMPMAALFVGGQGFVPAAWAVTLQLFGARPWVTPEGEDPGGGTGDAPHGPAGPPGGPTGDVDWARFEQQFAAYVRAREAERRGVASRPLVPA